MKTLRVEAELLDTTALENARRVVAGILVAVRASQRRRAVEPELRDAVAQLQPGVYMWHWQAWRMGGFERENAVGATTDGKVVVITPEAVLYGDPLTEEVVRIDQTPAHPGVKSKYRVH